MKIKTFILAMLMVLACGAPLWAQGPVKRVIFFDLDQTHFLEGIWNENDASNRTLNLLVNGADRTMDLSGNFTLSGANTVATWASTGAIEANSAGVSGETGIDFNSISGTYSTIAQSDAEGIAVSSDLRIGLDETTRNLIICGRGDIGAGDLAGLAVNANPTVFIYSSDKNKYLKLDGKTGIYGAISGFTIIGYSNITFNTITDHAAGNVYKFVSDANVELTDTDAEQAFVYLEPKINQTDTANYVGLLMDVTETSTGSGTNELMALRVATVDKFTVGNTGAVHHNGFISTPYYNCGASGASITIDWNDGNIQYVTLDNVGVDITFTEPPNPGKCELWIIQDGTGDRTIDWEHEVSPKWPGGVEPTLSTAAGAIDVVVFTFIGGTTYRGLFNGDFK